MDPSKRPSSRVEHPGDLLSMAFMALGITGEGSDYAEVEKILL
jgi:hypothetical protein